MLSKKNGAEISLNTQYIKYLSFKNIEAPQIYTYQNIKPNINVSLDMNAIKLQNEVYEVEIIVNIESKYSQNEEEKSMFSLNLNYAGIFTIKTDKDNLIQENLFIDCPTIIFPFLRRILSDTTRDANFPPLSLDIVDFEQLYNSKKAELSNIKFDSNSDKKSN